jgi:hypothetical protein
MLEFLLLFTLAQYCFLVGFAADYGDYGDSCSLRSRVGSFHNEKHKRHETYRAGLS